MGSHEIKKEPKSKSNSPKLTLTKTINGTTIPSSKTCNWVFENGQVCGKTFSKSYNLAVHMRMHEDIRPFACNHCDQTFRQKTSTEPPLVVKRRKRSLHARRARTTKTDYQE